MNILWLENDEALLRSIMRLMRACGHKVIGVMKIPDAIRELSEERYEMLVCDGTIETHGDGAEFAVQMKRQYDLMGGKTKVVIYSANKLNQRPGIPFVLKASPNLAEQLEAIGTSE